MNHAAFWCLTVLLLAAAASAQAPGDPLAADTRLDTRVRVHAEGVAVSDLLARLAAESGIRLSAEREAGDDKVILYGPPRPLREVLADLAVLFGHQWRHGDPKDGARTYVLAKFPAVRRREEDLAFGGQRQMRAQMEAQVRALRETPRQLALRPEGDLIRRHLTDPRARLATQLYAQLTPSQREAFFDRGRYHLFFAALRPEHRAAVLAVQREAYAGFDADSVRSVRAARRLPPETPSVDFSFDYGTDGRGRRLFDRGCLQMYPGGIRFADLRGEMDLPSLRGNPYTGERLPPDAPLPELKPEQSAEAEWPDRLRGLSEKTGRPVMADYYRLRFREPRTTEQPEGSGPAAALDQLCLADGSLWWTRGRTLLFRKRDWYLRRLYEVPDRWLTAWVRRLEAQEGQPRFGDLQRVAGLTYRQQQGLAVMGSRMTALPGAMRWWHDELAGLPELMMLLKSGPAARSRVPLINFDPLEGEARQEATEVMTLRFGAMTVPQRRWLLPFLALQRREVEGLPVETFRIVVRVRNAQARRREIPALPTEIEWAMKGHQGDYNLYLPLAIPDDRREKTVVRLEAERADTVGESRRCGRT